MKRTALQNKQVFYKWLFGPEKFSGFSRNVSHLQKIYLVSILKVSFLLSSNLQTTCTNLIPGELTHILQAKRFAIIVKRRNAKWQFEET